MKNNNFSFGFFFFVVLIVFTISCNGNGTGENQDPPPAPPENSGSVSSEVPPIDFKFPPKLYAHPDDGSINYSPLDGRKTLSLKGEFADVHTLSTPFKFSLERYKTLEIEILDIGESLFRNNESGPNKGDGAMLKLYITDTEGGPDTPLLCKDDFERDPAIPEFIVTGTGKREYDISSINHMYKIGFTFTNAKLNDFKLKVRFY